MMAIFKTLMFYSQPSTRNTQPKKEEAMQKQTCSMFLAAMALVAIAALYLSSPAFADVPQVLNYQGKLTNTDGTLVANGLYKMVFNLYQNNTGGAVWTETWDGASKVQVTNGLLNVLLGSMNTGTLGSVFQSNDNLYLGITVGADSEMSPRQRVASVGYAVQASKANNADKLGSLSSTDIVPIGTILAWHKSLTGVPALPTGWVECNGQVLNDSSSPLNGQTLPNLNGDKRFLRGGQTSGVIQGMMLEDHVHYTTVNYYAGYYAGGAWGLNRPAGNGFNVALSSGGATGSVGTETRPLNMSVVWIMRVR